MHQLPTPNLQLPRGAEWTRLWDRALGIGSWELGVDVSRFTSEERAIYKSLSRRGFMGATAAATLGALVGREPQLLRAAQAPQATADAVIVLWMAGGMAQTETFDPKRYTPFAPGVPINQVLSTFPTIDTVVDQIKFTQGLEQIGSVM